MIWKRKDENMVDSSEFIFDNVYRNKKEKEQFADNPRFAYFNAISKIRNREKSNNQICKSIFKLNNQQDKSSKKKQKNYNSDNSLKKFIRNNQGNTFNVQKINNHIFKIHKKKNRQSFQGMLDLNQINFRIINSNQRQIISKKQIKFKSFVTENPILQDPKLKPNENRKQSTAFKRYNDIKGVKRKIIQDLQ